MHQLSFYSVSSHACRASAASSGSDWFAEPNLKSIKEDPTNSDYGEQASTFELGFVQENPNNKSDEEDL